MKKFNFYVDELRSQWWRYYVEVEAENKEEAIRKAVDFDCEILESEWLYNSDDEKSISVEVLDTENYKILYSND